jgi:hypothetical protein
MCDQLDARVARQISVETAFWESDPFERPSADAVENIVNRGFDAAIFHEIHDALAAIVGASHRNASWRWAAGRARRRAW